MSIALTSLAEIEAAAERIGEVARRTPLVDVSDVAGRALWLKCENLQRTGSFKFRGAYHLISTLPVDVRRRGVITYSSGNHAQAVAHAAQVLDISAVVVMPTTAPAVKVAGARGYGAEVLFEGTTSVERRARAESVAAERDLTMVPPFDHARIIAGQGTAGLELVQDGPAIHTVFVPIGGGGLASGVAAAVKALSPTTRVVGVEPVGAAAMTASVAAGAPVTLDTVASVADGLMPVRPGDLTYAHVAALVDQVITVHDEAIAGATAWLFRRAKLVVEPSGAASVAAALADEPSRGGRVVAVVSGGNVSLETLAAVIGDAADAPRNGSKGDG